MGMAPDAAPAAPGPARAEHIAMTAAALALAVLVVLPLAFLVWGSLSGDGMLTLEHFREALSNRLYVTALRNSLVLGAWTAVLSVAIGLPLAWAVSRTDVPARRFVHATALIAYLTPPYLTAIAFVNLFSPNAGLVNRVVRDVLGVPALTFNVFSMSGLVLVTTLHTFPFVYLLAASALESVDASMEESAQILGAGRWRTAPAITGPLVAPAVLVGRADRVRQRHRAVRLAGHHRRCPAASSRCRRASTRSSTIRRATAWPRPCRWSSSPSRSWRAGAAATVPGPALLRHGGRQGRAGRSRLELGAAAGPCSRSASPCSSSPCWRRT